MTAEWLATSCRNCRVNYQRGFVKLAKGPGHAVERWKTEGSVGLQMNVARTLSIKAAVVAPVTLLASLTAGLVTAGRTARHAFRAALTTALMPSYTISKRALQERWFTHIPVPAYPMASRQKAGHRKLRLLCRTPDAPAEQSDISTCKLQKFEVSFTKLVHSLHTVDQCQGAVLSR